MIDSLYKFTLYYLVDLFVKVSPASIWFQNLTSKSANVDCNCLNNLPQHKDF